MTEEMMTEKQKKQVEKRILHFGVDKVKSYIHRFFPNADVYNLTKVEAQKIITGMTLPCEIRGVYGRDFKFFY